MLHGIFDEVAHSFRRPVHIPSEGAGTVHREGLFPQLHGDEEGGGGLAHHLLQGDGVGAEGDGARLQLRELQKGGHQPVHLAQQLGQIPAQLGPPLGGEVLFVQQLRHQIHGGEGGAQLVG